MENSSEPKLVSGLKLYEQFPTFIVNPAKLFHLFLEQNNQLNILRRENYELGQENEKLRSRFSCWYIEISKESLPIVTSRKELVVQNSTAYNEEEPKPQIEPVKIKNHDTATQTDTTRDHAEPPSKAANLTIRVEIVTKTNNAESSRPAEDVIIKTVELSQSQSTVHVLQQPLGSNATKRPSGTGWNNTNAGETDSKQNEPHRERIERHEATDCRTVSRNTRNTCREMLPMSANSNIEDIFKFKDINSNDRSTGIQLVCVKSSPSPNFEDKAQNVINNDIPLQIRDLIETQRASVYRNRKVPERRTDFTKTVNETRETRFRNSSYAPQFPKKDPNSIPVSTDIQVKCEDIPAPGTSPDPIPSRTKSKDANSSGSVLTEGPVLIPVQVCQKRKKTLKDIFTWSKAHLQSPKVLETIPNLEPQLTPRKLESEWAKNRNMRKDEILVQEENNKVNCQPVKGIFYGWDSTGHPGNGIPEYQKTFASPTPTPSAPQSRSPTKPSVIRQPRN